MKIRVKLIVILCIFVDFLHAQGLDENGNEDIDQFQGFDIPEDHGFHRNLNENESESTKFTKTSNQISSDKLDLAENSTGILLPQEVAITTPVAGASSVDTIIDKIKNIIVSNENEAKNSPEPTASIVLEPTKEPVNSNHSFEAVEVAIRYNEEPPTSPPKIAFGSQLNSTTNQSSSTPASTTNSVYTKITFEERVIHLDPTHATPIAFKKLHPDLPENCSKFKVIKHLSIIIDKTETQQKKIAFVQMMSQYFSNFSPLDFD